MSLRADFRLSRGEFTLSARFHITSGITGVSGASGSGKTSLLRAIAGLETIDGQLHWGNCAWQSLAANQRPIGYVFQEPRLFPHLSVQRNLQFAAKRASAPLPLTELATRLGLTELLSQRPNQLSGGQAQRVALARALIQNPQLLLLDEPLANLDQRAKRELLDYITHVNHHYQTPMLYVSHSADELAQICDQLLLVERAGQHARAEQLQPIQTALLALAGDDNPVSLLHATVTGYDCEFELCELAIGEQRWWLANPALPADLSVRLKIHARDVSISRDAHCNSSIQNRLLACVEKVINDTSGPHCTVQLRVENQPLLARITRRAQAQLQLQQGDWVYAQVKAAAMA